MGTGEWERALADEQRKAEGRLESIKKALPAGQLHAELLRTEGHRPAAPPPLPADTATLPVPRALQVA